MEKYGKGKETKELSLEDKQNMSKAKLIEAARDYTREAEDIAHEWQDRAEKTWDIILGRKDWSHKKEENAKIHINRVGIAHEQAKANFKQALMNFDKWLQVETSVKVDEENEVINSEAAKRIVKRGIHKTNARAKITDNIGIGMAENLISTKLCPVVETVDTRYGKRKELYIKHEILDINSYYKDSMSPDGACLYEIHKSEVDKYVLLSMASDKPSEQYPYMKDEVMKLSSHIDATVDEDLLEQERNRGTDITRVRSKRRSPILIHEIWGTVLDNDGQVMEYTKMDGSTITLENVVFTIANNNTLIEEPRKISTFDGSSYFISMQLLRTNVNGYGKAILESGVDMNIVEDELFSAGVDAALKEANNSNVLKVNGLVDPKQADGGLKPDVTYFQNGELAPGERLIDSVPTGKVPNGLLNLLQIVKQAGTENVLSNIPAQGGVVGKTVKATELTIANQSIGGLLESIAADIEDIYIEEYAKKVFLLMLQYKKYLSEDDLEYIFDGNKERIKRFEQETPKSLFKAYGSFFKFRGKGVRSVAANMRQAQTLVQVMSMIVANPLMAQSFERKGYDVTIMIDEILTNMGMDTDSYRNEELAQFAQQRELIQTEAMANSAAQQGAPKGATNAGGPAASAEEPGSGAGY